MFKRSGFAIKIHLTKWLQFQFRDFSVNWLKKYPKLFPQPLWARFLFFLGDKECLKMILSYLLKAQDLWTPVKFGATVLSSKDNNL